MIRRLRANMLDELQKQYVVTGRAKGLPPVRLLMKYPLRVALNPFIADIGNLLPQMVSGSVIVSVVMSLPTVGPVLLNALQSQDMYLAGSVLMVLALLTVIGMLLSDLALAALDPRIRLSGGATK
jgi:peptide/nickel transport system permease protein